MATDIVAAVSIAVTGETPAARPGVRLDGAGYYTNGDNGLCSHTAMLAASCLQSRTGCNTNGENGLCPHGHACDKLPSESQHTLREVCMRWSVHSAERLHVSVALPHFRLWGGEEHCVRRERKARAKPPTMRCDGHIHLMPQRKDRIQKRLGRGAAEQVTKQAGDATLGRDLHRRETESFATNPPWPKGLLGKRP